MITLVNACLGMGVGEVGWGGGGGFCLGQTDVVPAVMKVTMLEVDALTALSFSFSLVTYQ